MRPIDRLRERVQALTSPAGTLAGRHRQVVSAGATSTLRSSATSLQLVWWRWRHLFLEAKRLDLALRQNEEG